MNRESIAFCVFLFLIVFLFQDDPDHWDLLHEKAMTWARGQA